MPSLLLQSLFPLVFIMLLGWLSGKLGYTRREDASVLATVVIRFALPFHLFIGALHTSPDKIKNFTFMAVLVIGLMGSYFLTLLISRYVFRHDIKTSAIQSLVCAFPDMAYFGAPVLAVLIGPEGFLGVLIGNLGDQRVDDPSDHHPDPHGRPARRRWGSPAPRRAVDPAKPAESREKPHCLDPHFRRTAQPGRDPAAASAQRTR